jgi:hypothetical protein
MDYGCSCVSFPQCGCAISTFPPGPGHARLVMQNPLLERYIERPVLRIGRWLGWSRMGEFERLICGGAPS